MLHSTCSLRDQEKSFHCIQRYTISKVITGDQRCSLLKQQAFAIIREQRLYLAQQRKDHYFLVPLLLLYLVRVLELQFLR